MQPSRTSLDGTVTESTPPSPIEVITHDEEGQEEEKTRPQIGGWWNKVQDLEEAKHQLLFSVPMTLANLFYHLITLVSVMLAGHLGGLQLAGATLASSWFGVTGMAAMLIPVSSLYFPVEYA